MAGWVVATLRCLRVCAPYLACSVRLCLLAERTRRCAGAPTTARLCVCERVATNWQGSCVRSSHRALIFLGEWHELLCLSYSFWCIWLTWGVDEKLTWFWETGWGALLSVCLQFSQLAMPLQEFSEWNALSKEKQNKVSEWISAYGSLYKVVALVLQ